MCDNSFDESGFPENRILYLCGEIDEESVLEIKKQIISYNMKDDVLEEEYYMEKENALQGLIIDGEVKSIDIVPYPREPITLFIDSGGGSIYAGFALINIMTTSNTPINTIVDGKAMSMALLIAMAGDQRFAFKNSSFMFHDSGFGVWSDTTDIKRELEEITRLDKKYEDLIKEWSYITDEWMQDIKDKRKNYYFDGIEALNLGVVDQLLDYEEEEPEYTGECALCGEVLIDCECGVDE